MSFLIAFAVGGIICVIGQIFIDRTSLTPAKILVIFVVSGAILSALGLYEPLVEFAGGGATVPLTGFGHSLAKGAIEGAQQNGILGAFIGGIKNTAAGISAAILFGYLNALIFKPKSK